jgi:hypothetical protein
LKSMGLGSIGGGFASHFRYETAPYEPSQRFDEKITRKVLSLGSWPLLHRKMPCQNHFTAFEKCEPGRSMCQPPDVFSRLAQQRPLPTYHLVVERRSDGSHEREHNALWRGGVQELMLWRINEIADEESCARPCLSPLRWNKPIASERASYDRGRVVSVQVGSSKRSDPRAFRNHSPRESGGVRATSGRITRTLRAAHLGQRPSNG